MLFASTLRAFVLATSIAVLACVSMAQTAKKLTPVPGAGQNLTGKPLALQQQMQTVFLQLSAAPVAAVRARVPGKKLALAVEQSVASSVRSQQDALLPMIQAQGVRVLARTQYAFNGIKVRATRDQIAQLARLPGVIAVKPVGVYKIENATSVPFLGTPTVWQGPPGLHGEHIKVAVIDTGIDYTHANFGGPGTVAAFQSAAAASTLPADPSLFGPSAPKVKGGTDLVGDNYDASTAGKDTPQPDPNPLDCNGHGSHVAGTIGGFGVAANGSTFAGPYDASTPSNQFIIGPGMAPLSDLYAVRVFGCSGSTNVTVEAIDWAVANHMDVISMSLGSNFGAADTVDAEAATNAANAGIVVAAASGNAGNIPYITSTPAAGDKGISVAAMDSHPFLAGGINISFSSGINVNGVEADTSLPLPSGSVPAVILTSAGSLAVGCSASDYPSGGVPGALVIVARGTCTFITKAQLATSAGAVAIGVVNNTSGFFNPAIQGVTIPFFELQQQDGPTLAAAASPETASIAFANVPNPAANQFASFSSSGPRLPDSHLKPDITAPGVSIFSTLSGSGNQGELLSGTSMATPHVSGAAALTLQAHPTWSPDDSRLALVNTADPTKLVGFVPRLGGSGLVQPIGATETSVVARADDDSGSLSFGLEEFSDSFQGTQNITVTNHGSQAANFNVSAAAASGSTPHSSNVESFLSVPAGGTGTLHFTLTVPAATIGTATTFREVSGLVTLTPASPSDNSGITLTVPYYLVPLGRSQVTTRLSSAFGFGNASTNAIVSNSSLSVAGAADFYAWGLAGENSGLGSVGLRGVGVQSFSSGSGEVLDFAVNTFLPWTYAGLQEFDILLDVDGDGTPDFDVFSDDFGRVTTGSFNGQVAAFILNLKTNALSADFFAAAPYNGSTIELPVIASHVGVTSVNPRFSYSAESFDLLSSRSDVISGPARFNAFSNAISTAEFVSLSPGSSTTVPLSINSTEFTNTPPLGEMIVSLDNFARAQQAEFLQLSTPPSTTVNLTSSLNPAVYGQSVTFTASVVGPGGTPTGTITFKDGASSISTATLDGNGSASFASSSLLAGPHSITAVYGGDSNFSGNTSAPLTESVNQSGTTLSLASTANPSAVGQSVTLTATITPQFGGQTTGSVTFKDGATVLATAAVSSNQASYTSNALSLGSHAITAAYGGDANFLSSSAALSQVVSKPATTTLLTSSVNPATQGKPVKFTATVSPQVSGTPTGKINFVNGTTVLATHTLTAGVATYSTSALPTGSSNISAVYLGDATFTGSTSNTVVEVVKAAVTTSLTSSVNPSTFGQPVTFTATLSSTSGLPADGETVTFLQGTTVLGTGTLASGVATFTTSSLKAGTLSIKAAYAGDATFASSVSTALTQTVTKASTTTTLASSVNPSNVGQSVTFTATVNSGAGTPTGTVTFMSDGVSIGNHALSGGVAVLTTKALAAGAHNITATYVGSPSYATSTGALTQTVGSGL